MTVYISLMKTATIYNPGLDPDNSRQIKSSWELAKEIHFFTSDFQIGNKIEGSVLYMYSGP